MSEDHSPLDGPARRRELVAPEAVVDGEMRRRSRRSLMWGAAALLGLEGGRRWLNSRRRDDGMVWPLRRALQVNEGIWRDYFRPTRTVRTYPKSLAKMPRPNGLGWSRPAAESTWRLQVRGPVGESFTFTLDDIKSLPRVEQVTRLCCIEGWSEVVHWAGTRFSSLVEHISEDLAMTLDYVKYVGLVSSGDSYFVGLDIESAMHPQTLLCYEMMGAPLEQDHGYPLRLVIPTKYGIKSIKQVAMIELRESRPDDYWALRGYDWYAGL